MSGMGRVKVMVDAEGRLVLPEEIRMSLGLESGGEISLSVENHELRGSTFLGPARASTRRAGW
jgi:bifunctional DNA-binding transcriptional regulator/antitoxin component of YhaV-PrlF toxin-antitoxin module